MIEATRIRLQWAIIRAQAYWLPGLILRWICRLGTWRVGRLLMRFAGVEAVYVRHTHPRSPSFIPGHSDLDLTVIISDEASGSPEKIEAIARFLEDRRLFYYYLSPDDARIMTVSELARMTERWPPVEIFVGPQDWTLQAGKEVRPEGSMGLGASQTAWHPEFNRWWHHILQDYLILSMPGHENRYHRVFCRGAVKQAAYFLLASGEHPPAHEAFTDKRLARWVMDRKPGLEAVLDGLEESGYWEGDRQNARELIFQQVLQDTERFYAEFPGHPGADDRNPVACTPGESHAAAYQALAAKIESLPDLESRLAGVLVYPTPHCYPYFYQADLLLPADMSAEDLIALAGIIRQEFRGREFESDGHHYSITLVPERVYQSPLVFRGSPFPFLADHVRQHGQLLFGSLPLTLKAVDRQELREWCRMFLPYFMSNLSRRVEHSSRTLNFCHIAAVRLFLATGEIVTDPMILKTRHSEAFGPESPSVEAWEYLLRDKPGRGDHTTYLSAASYLELELERVEMLLHQTPGQ